MNNRIEISQLGALVLHSRKAMYRLSGNSPHRCLGSECIVAKQNACIVTSREIYRGY